MADFPRRLRQLEQRVDFLMASVRMKGAIGTGLLKADGTPDVRIIEGSLEEFFRLSKGAEVIEKAEDVLGTDIVEGETISNG